jgi:hypothetical protein
MKCLWCEEAVELSDPGMYQFCDRCLANLETLCLDLEEAEGKLRVYRERHRTAESTPI